MGEPLFDLSVVVADRSSPLEVDGMMYGRPWKRRRDG